MTLQQMQEASRKRQEAIIGAWGEQPYGLTRDLLRNYRGAYTTISADLKSAYAKLAGVSPDNAGYYNELLKYNRLTALQRSTAEAYRKAARKAGLGQYAASQLALSNQYYENQYTINWFSDAPYFSTLDQKIVEVSVYGTPKIWESIKASNRDKYGPYLPQYGTLSELLNANAAKDLEMVSRTITQRLRQGKSYSIVARDLRKIFNTTANNAIRIARTEGNRNLNSGAFANSQAAMDAGIQLERMYLATLDTRTREQSAAMDGQVRPADKPFEYGGLSWFIPGNSGNPAYDINDRCTVIDRVDGKNPALRRGRNPATGQTEVADFGSFDDWMSQNNLTRNKSGRIVSR